MARDGRVITFPGHNREKDPENNGNQTCEVIDLHQAAQQRGDTLFRRTGLAIKMDDIPGAAHLGVKAMQCRRVEDAFTKPSLFEKVVKKIKGS